MDSRFFLSVEGNRTVVESLQIFLKKFNQRMFYSYFYHESWLRFFNFLTTVAITNTPPLLQKPHCYYRHPTAIVNTLLAITDSPLLLGKPFAITKTLLLLRAPRCCYEHPAAITNTPLWPHKRESPQEIASNLKLCIQSTHVS